MGKKFFEGENFNIPKNRIVKVEEYTKGRTKVTYSTANNTNLLQYERKKGNKYIDPITGLEKSYSYSKRKSNENLRRSLNHTVRPLLENNFFGGDNEVFVTLTYANTMTNFWQITKDYDRFWRRLCNKYKHLELGCVYIKEIQENRSSWHIHSLIKEINNKPLNIPYALLSKMWGLGNVWINRVLPRLDLSNYQINIDKEMEKMPFGNVLCCNKVIDYMCKLKSKEKIFPSGSKIHGNKGNLKGPIKTAMTYDKAIQEKLNNSNLLNENTLLVVNDKDNTILNCIHKEFWLDNNTNSSQQ